MVGTPSQLDTTLLLAVLLACAPSYATAPANDDCSSGPIIPASPYADSQGTSGATTTVADPAPPCGNGSRAMSVWYRFTAPAAGGSLTVDTFGSDYDTILSAWSGSCGQLTAWAGGCNDDFGVAQSQLTLAVPGGDTVYLMVSAFFGDGGNLVVHASFASGSGDVTGLILSRASGGDLTLSWNPSCRGTDADYGIYQGLLGSWASHDPVACTTAGAATAIITPAPSSSYYLIVPQNASREGSYGRDGAGTERPPSVAACAAQALAGCPPACAHDTCTVGGELTPACDACAAQICAVDPFCCDVGWDGACVTEVRSVCSSLVCADSGGTCAHGLCVTGAGLAAQCDDPPVDPSCVTMICNADAFCCTSGWDVTCVAEVGAVCGWNCN